MTSLFFVSDCHVLFFKGRKNNFMGFGFSISVWGPILLYIYFCHHLFNCNLVSTETCNLEFQNLKLFRIVHFDFKIDGRNIRCSQRNSRLSYTFFNENYFNPKVSLNIHNSKSVMHKCLYRHTLKETLNL